MKADHKASNVYGMHYASISVLYWKDNADGHVQVMVFK